MAESNRTITRISPTQRDPLRVTIRAGGKVVATLRRDHVKALGLEVGSAWTDDLAAKVAGHVDRDKAMRYAMRAIARRALSRGELIDRIVRRGHDKEMAGQIVQTLADKGWLDDERYGQTVIETERARKPTGDRLLRYKLANKRVPRELADRLVNEAAEDHDAVGQARAFAKKKLSQASMHRADPQTRQRRLWGQLARRGFDPQTIREALAPLFADGSFDE